MLHCVRILLFMHKTHRIIIECMENGIGRHIYMMNTCVHALKYKFVHKIFQYHHIYLEFCRLILPAFVVSSVQLFHRTTTASNFCHIILLEKYWQKWVNKNMKCDKWLCRASRIYTQEKCQVNVIDLYVKPVNWSGRSNAFGKWICISIHCSFISFHCLTFFSKRHSSIRFGKWTTIYF